MARTEGCNSRMVEAVMKMHLVALDVFLKQKDGLTKEEIELIVEEVMDKWGNLLSFADINVVFRNAKLGRYGELYQQLTCAKVVKWFDDYADERMEMAYDMNRQKDREMYGRQRLTTEQMANSIGSIYSINEDGRLIIDPKKVERNAMEAQKAREEKKEAENKRKRDAAEMMRWEVEYKVKCIMGKPESEWSENERKLVNQYNNSQNQSKK
ncbi:MAG: hypothetical protein SPJ13_01255 [Bacteroidales bacterium]|nr:hypothetical protein [Bacteroidales bacterium]